MIGLTVFLLLIFTGCILISFGPILYWSPILFGRDFTEFSMKVTLSGMILLIAAFLLFPTYVKESLNQAQVNYEEQ